MDKELKERIKRNKELVKKYPFLVIKINPWTGEKLYKKDYDYEYIWWDDIPDGWREAFGEQMCDELLEILKKADCVDKYEIVQIKEKFGGLRWYDNGVPESVKDEYFAWLNKYEVLSENTCINCGKPSTHFTGGWIMPMCDNCDKHEE